MGPRRDWRGYVAGFGPDQRGIHPLQWGHAVIGVDTGLCREPAMVARQLQWGHAVIGVDTRRRGHALVGRV